jgi:hypothetical protein
MVMEIQAIIEMVVNEKTVVAIATSLEDRSIIEIKYLKSNICFWTTQIRMASNILRQDFIKNFTPKIAKTILQDDIETI